MAAPAWLSPTLVIVSLVTVSLWPRPSDAATDTPPVYVDASSNNFPPVNLLDDRQALTGFGAELADAVISAVGGTTRHIHSPVWTDVLQWLDSGEADFIHDTGYAPDRTAFLDYSEPILEMPEDIFVLSSRFDVNSLESLDGKRVACVNKHITHLYLQKFPGITCHVVKTPPDGVRALLAGDVDAFIYPRQIVLYYAYELNAADRIKSVGEPLRTLTWHMVVKKGNTEMLLLLNRGIAKVKASGEYDRIYGKWFGRNFGAYSETDVWRIVGAVVVLAVLIAGAAFLWTWLLHRTVARQTAALRASEARFTDFAEAASDWFWEIDADLRFTYFSERFYEITGRRPEDEIGVYRTELYEPAGSPEIAEKWAAHHADLDARRPFKDFEYVLSSKVGNDRHVRVSGTPVFDRHGAFQGYRGTGNDITERRQAAEVLRASELRLSGILNMSADAIVSIDEEHKIVLFNRGAQSIFGYDPDEIIGQSIEKLLPDRFHDDHQDYVAAFGRSPEESRLLMSRRGDLTGLRKDGTEFPAEASISKLEIAGQTIFTASLRDVSDRKKAEDTLRHAQKIEAVGQLTGGIAHDFNNLLAAILGHAELLSNRLEPDDKSLEVLMKTVDRGAELTQRLLAFSRRQTLSPKSIDVNGLVNDVIVLLRRTLPANIDIIIDASQSLWPCKADRAQMENALLNLAVNARDAMPGGGALTIEMTNMTVDDDLAATFDDVSPGDYVRISVSDTGHGISDEDIAHVFEPFFTTKDVGQGSGLGLSMVYGFAKQSRGHVAIGGEEGRGTIVDLLLPRADSPVSEIAKPVVTDAEPLGRDETILVVEDEQEVRQMIVMILDTLGYNAVEAANGDQALAILMNNPRIDLLLTDVMLPGGMSGPEIVAQARRHAPDIKTVFMSGYAARAITTHVQLPDNAELLNKPFTRRELATRVSAALGHRAA